MEMYGRKITPGFGRGRRCTCTCRGRTAGVFNAAALQLSKDVIVCEALIDALTFWCAGFRNVTSAYGVEGFTEELQRSASASTGRERVLHRVRRRRGGQQGGGEAGGGAWRRGLEVLRVVFPKGMDANEYALKVKPADKALGHGAARSAVDGGAVRRSRARSRSERRRRRCTRSRRRARPSRCPRSPSRRQRARRRTSAQPSPFRLAAGSAS